jgi:hypothetical protein
VSKIKVRYRKLPYQAEFHASMKPKCFLSAGYGGGKTYSLVMKTLKLMDINKGLPGGFLAPDLKMFKRDVWPTYKEISGKYRFKVEFNKQDSLLYFPTTKTEVMVFHDQDNGESIRGPNLAWGAINEVTLISEAGFKAFLARVRMKKAKLRQIAMSGTPEGFTWHYDYFIDAQREDTDLIFGDMRLNRFVADDYAKGLMDSYDDVMVQQFVEGKYINLNGKGAVYKFNRTIHTDVGIERIPNLPVYVSIDFNVAPMAATFWNLLSGDRLQAFDEICIKDNADTYILARLIKEKVGTDGVVLFPDPAGNQRKTSATKTDIQILRDEGFEDIRYKKSIKSVKEQLLAVNSFFGKNRIRLDRDKCREAIKDLEQCALLEGTNDIDKSDPKRTHWLDGIKNMIHYEFPVVQGAGGWREVAIR